ncbi:MAG TPA: LPS export ABC transporter permease LptF [Terriglobales bacterium]|nr:LPS export ABC transporter permease LptF [Terriglobales bacterium]
MRTFTRYILHEVVTHGLIGAALFTFIVFMRDMGRLLELVVRNSAPASAVAALFVFTLPTALTLTIPMGVLVGVLLGLSRLAADSEITAMRAVGVGSWQFVRIVSLFAVASFAIAFFNSVYVAPRSAAALDRLQNRLKSSQASFEIQPRVFYEDFKNVVLYVSDVTATRGAAEWHGIFLADVSNPADPKVTLAQRGVIAQQSPGEMRLHLENGSEHNLVPGHDDQYQITTFTESDIPVQLPATSAQAPPSLALAETPTTSLPALWHDRDATKARTYSIEFHRRLALPAACLVLTLIGIPLGLSSHKGGKATGFVLTIALVFIYYFVSLLGISFAKQGRIPAGLGVWLANIVFFAGGIALMLRVDKRPIDAIAWLRTSVADLKPKISRRIRSTAFANGIGYRSVPANGVRRLRFPMIVDQYIVRDFVLFLLMIQATFIVLFLVFTLFERVGDILRNHVSPTTVGEYLLDIVPSTVYLLLFMSVLVAVLVTFGLMSRANEVTAMKATGISIYRVVVPVIVISAMLAAGLFFFDEAYLPRINRRQETLLNRIKGKPPQTYLQPGRKWIFGDHHDIYYYQAYDPERPAFGNVSIFEFDPQSFSVTRRVFASRAHWEPELNKWVFEHGWERRFDGASIEDYRTFDVTTFAELNEAPSYFRKEVRQSQEMSYSELKNYIQELQQSGFDVVRLRVQLQKKLAFPLIVLVMAILAIPFSLSSSRRGALTGVATAIAIAVIYWLTAGLFEAMGNVNQLPPLLAAWTPDLLFAIGGGYLLLKVPT